MVEEAAATAVVVVVDSAAAVIVVVEDSVVVSVVIAVVAVAASAAIVVVSANIPSMISLIPFLRRAISCWDILSWRTLTHARSRHPSHLPSLYRKHQPDS